MFLKDDVSSKKRLAIYQQSLIELIQKFRQKKATLSEVAFAIQSKQ